MRRTAAAAALTLLAASIQLATAAPAPALVLPPAFQLVDYPTGQAPAASPTSPGLNDGGLMTTGKDGTITFVPPGGTPRVVTGADRASVGGPRHARLRARNDYATTGRVYLTYDKGGATGTGFGMVEEWTASPPAVPRSSAESRTIIDGSPPHPISRRSPSTTASTRSWWLPTTPCSSASATTPRNNGDAQTLRAQDTNQPYGKVLHLMPDGKGVASNPFYSAAARRSWRSMTYAYGLRNPFRLDAGPTLGRAVGR